ncbi:branched-chain amino acid aminotransferase, partial [Nitrosococcus oceani C-27]
IEREIPRTEIYFAEEVFLTGTAAEITPVISVDGKRVGDNKVGKITENIRKIYSDITMGKNKKYSKWVTPVY